MVKKFYYGLVSLKYAYAMFGIPLVIFTIAFVETKSHHPVFQIFMGICAVILAAVMVFYYRDKLRIRKTIRAVKDVNAYLSGGMVDRTYILEDRMLACADLNLKEMSTTGVKTLELREEKHGKPYMKLTYDSDVCTVTAISMEEAQRFTAFIQRKNPDVQISGIEPKGNGTLKELGASR